MPSDRTHFRKSGAQGAYRVSLLPLSSGEENSLGPTGQICKRLGPMLPFLLTMSTAMFARSDLDVRAKCSKSL